MTDVKRLQKNVVLAIYILCFAGATLNHSLDFLRGGWLPYRSGPIRLRFFWTVLVILDPVVIGLLLFNRLRSGLLLALAVMLSDVAANSYAAFMLRFGGFSPDLQWQILFLGFVLGSSPFLWPMREPSLPG
jgi:hypothetical protein